jgi:chemotaxis protein CheY-P-specific phosphatase CheC
LQNSQIIFLLRLNVCNDLAKAMKAMDGKKKSQPEGDQIHHSALSPRQGL